MQPDSEPRSQRVGISAAVPEASAQRPHAISSGTFVLLEGLRGVAALIVVSHHFAGRVGLLRLFAHGYLAVDFFFILSGFIAAHAYFPRIRAGLGAKDFMLARLVRMLPLLVPGTVFGAIVELWRPGVGGSGRHLLEILGALPLGCLAIPILIKTDMEATVFPINGPVWSVCLQILGCMLFHRLVSGARPQRAVWLVMMAGAAGIVAVAVTHGDLDVGALVINWPGGIPRLLYGFFAGFLLYQYRDHFPRVPAMLLVTVFVASAMIPGLGMPWGAFTDAIEILLLLPLLVALASQCRVSGRIAGWCGAIGALSYPIYAIHYPFIRVVSVLTNKLGRTTSLKLAVLAISIVIVVVVARLLLVYYEPVARRWLQQALTAGTPSLRRRSRQGAN